MNNTKKRTAREEFQLNGIIWIFTFIIAAAEAIFWYIYYMYIRPLALSNPEVSMPIVFIAFFAIGLFSVVYALRRMKERPGRKAKCTLPVTARLCGMTSGLKYPILDFGHFRDFIFIYFYLCLLFEYKLLHILFSKRCLNDL